VEPLELGHLERTPLPDLGVDPGVGVEEVGVDRIEQARRAEREIREQDRQQGDAEALLKRSSNRPTIERGDAEVAVVIG
jgi:hypothetical protein